MSDTLSPDSEWLAADYALGVLGAADMRLAEARRETDPAFAADLRYWEERLSPLASLVPPVTPPASLWPRLALAAGVGAAAGRRPVFWQGATAVSLLVAASLALVALLPPINRTERLAAALGPINNPARFLVSAAPDGSLAVTGLGNPGAPAGRSFQLWALPQGATVPVSLGVLPQGPHTIPPGHAAAGEQLLVSEEPAGGSPTGAPTGPVVFGGTLTPVTPAASPGR